MPNNGNKGCIVELLSMNDIQAPPVGALGVVCYEDDAEQIHVQWETGSSLALIPGHDRYRYVTDTEGFTEKNLLDYAYCRYSEKWQKDHGVTDQMIRDTYTNWKKYLEEEAADVLFFQDYLHEFGFTGLGMGPASKDEFANTEFADKDIMHELLRPLAFSAWVKLYGKEAQHECAVN